MVGRGVHQALKEREKELENKVMDESVTLRFWHGGLFKKNRKGKIHYLGGEAKTYPVDPDHLCGWFLEDMAKNCGGYRKIDKVFYQLPNSSLDDGLRQVFDDKQVLELIDIVSKTRSIDLFVLHGVDDPIDAEIVQLIGPGIGPESEEESPQVNPQPQKVTPQRSKLTPEKNKQIPPKLTPQKDKQMPPKLTPQKQKQQQTPKKVSPPQSSPLRRSPRFTTTHSPSISFPNPNENITQTPQPVNETPHPTNPLVQHHHDGDEYYRWYDPRPDSPIPHDQLVGSVGSTSESDSNYEVEIETEEEDSDTRLEEEFEIEEEEKDDEILEVDGGDSSDDEELRQAREIRKRATAKLIQISEQTQKEAVEGKGKVAGESSTTGVREGGYVSDYANSEDDEDSPDEDGDEDVMLQRRRARKLRVNLETDWNTFKWKVGQRFPNRSAFKEAVKKFAIYQGRQLSFVSSNKKRGQRLEVRCEETCKFRLYGSWDTGSACFLVKSFDDGHNCTRNMSKNKQLTSTWLAEQFLEVFKNRPHWPAKEIVETVKRAYKAFISEDLAYKVKGKAHKKLHGSMKEHYMKVGRYLQALKQSSPGSRLELVTNEENNPPVFQRLFCCFKGVAEGWKAGCRRVLCIDACFIKTFLGGQLLAAVGRDGNDQMFPVAWAVVEGENNDSWEWFLTLVTESLGLRDGRGLAIISDEHLSILYAVEKVLPQAEHRHCARHIYAHWHKTFRGDEFKKLFWRAAKAYSKAEFDEAIAEMREVSPDAVEAFNSYNPRLFCRHLMNTDTKVDVIVNNLAETFNGFIINARTKHLLYMVEEIRTSLMQRLALKKQQMQKVNAKVCPRIQLKLDKAKDGAANCIVVPSTAEIFQVSEGIDVLMVNLAASTCTCGVWDLSGVPCSHAIACIFFCRMNAEDFVSHWYLTSTYLMSYNSSIPPCVGERHWPKVNLPLIPPPIKIGPGRPRKNRIKDPFENPKKPGRLTKHGIQMTCSICKSSSHNKRKCPNKDNVNTIPPNAPPSKRQRTTTEKSAGDTSVLNATAEPSRTGRGGRVIRGRSRGVNVGVPWRGRGSRGSINVGRGTKGRGQVAESLMGRGRGQVAETIIGRGRGQVGGRGGSEVGRRIDSGGRGSRGRDINVRGNARGRARGYQVPIGVGVYMAEDGNVFQKSPSMRVPVQLTQSSTSIGGAPLGTQGSGTS